MTRKDYELIARSIKWEISGFYGELERTAIASTVERLARAFAAENPRFDRERFIKACGC